MIEAETGQAKPQVASAAGQLRGRQWVTVYKGPDVKCYTIKFSSLTGPSQADKDPGIGIYVDGDQAQNCAATLTIGQSADVCGKQILVYGRMHEAQVASWEASEAGVTDWFEW